MIYFIRHGESEANLKHVFAGQKDDSPLTENISVIRNICDEG